MPCLPVNKTMGDKVVRDYFPYRAEADGEATDMKEADIKQSSTRPRRAPEWTWRPPRGAQNTTASHGEQAIQLAVWMLRCIIN